MLKKATMRLTVAALCLALCLILPLLTGGSKELGRALCLMHIGALICGYLCGWYYGFAVGAIAPILRFFIFGKPSLYPDAISMAFELAVYGLLTGVLYKVFPKKTRYIYISLIIAMIAGRIVKGIVDYILIVTIKGGLFTFKMFIMSDFAYSVLGILFQMAFIPMLVKELKNEKILTD